MNYVQVKGMSLPDTYHKALVALKEYGDIVPCPDYNTEMIECSMDMIVQKPLLEPMISKCGIYSPKDLQQYLLEIKEGIDKYYLSQLLKFEQIKKRLTGISRGVRQANISNKDILNLVVPVPPMELQDQYSDFVHQVDKSKVVIAMKSL